MRHLGYLEGILSRRSIPPAPAPTAEAIPSAGNQNHLECVLQDLERKVEAIKGSVSTYSEVADRMKSMSDKLEQLLVDIDDLEKKLK